MRMKGFARASSHGLSLVPGAFVSTSTILLLAQREARHPAMPGLLAGEL
jgi:hypothetical protein